MKPNHLVLALLVAVVVIGVAEPAFACSVCFDANDETRGAFLGTTIFLSLLPLGVMGGIAFYIWRRAVAVAAEEAALVAMASEESPLTI